MAGIQSKIGFLFFLCINQTFGVVFPLVNAFVPQRPIIRRERASGSYRSSTAYLELTISFFAKFLITVPLNILGALVLIVPIYFMVGLQATVDVLYCLANN
jgi:ABC-type multidrug transport system permease subunit